MNYRLVEAYRQTCQTLVKETAFRIVLAAGLCVILAFNTVPSLAIGWFIFISLGLFLEMKMYQAFFRNGGPERLSTVQMVCLTGSTLINCSVYASPIWFLYFSDQPSTTFSATVFALGMLFHLISSRANSLRLFLITTAPVIIPFIYMAIDISINSNNYTPTILLVVAYVTLSHTYVLKGRQQRELNAAIMTAEHARKEALKAAQAKGNFLANMSHEIRTPMNGILGMTEILKLDTLTDTQKRHVDIIQTSSQSLLSIINDILDISKIEAGHLRLRPGPFEPRALVDGVNDLLRARAAEKQIALVDVFDPSLPHKLEGDEGRLRQVLTNLVGNAVKFTETGEVRVTVSGEHSGAHYMMRVEVTDTGCGIEAALLGNVFNKFYQVDDTSTRRHEGTGLGLSICQQLIEQMGGEIGVQSTVNEGSTFWFTVKLPVIEATQTQSSPAPYRVPNPQERSRDHTTQAQPARFTPGRKMPRILVVEDNITNQAVIAEILDMLGYEFTLASNGEEGVNAFSAIRPDLVLMDISMPLMGGYEATSQIRAQPAGRSVPIIALTANAMGGDRALCIQAGMDDYLPKPIKLNALRQCLQNWLSHIQNAAQ